MIYYGVELDCTSPPAISTLSSFKGFSDDLPFPFFTFSFFELGLKCKIDKNDITISKLYPTSKHNGSSHVKGL